MDIEVLIKNYIEALKAEGVLITRDTIDWILELYKIDDSSKCYDIYLDE